MANARPYEVTLKITGPVKIVDEIVFKTEKELNIGEVFHSGIQVKPDIDGFHIVVTVFTSEQDQANKIALLFVGRMLDILSMQINTPLFVSLTSDWEYKKKTNQKAILRKSDFQYAFNFSRARGDNYSTFLRGLSWRRKALYTEDPYDRFFAYWLSIEVIANKLNPTKENCKDEKTGIYKGTICNIWESFKYLWGAIENWPIIQGQKDWIDQNAAIRNKIGHGTFAVDIRSVDEVFHKLRLLNQVSFTFLKDWGRKAFNVNFDSD